MANREVLHAQMQYLEQSKKRQEELRSFRHDIREHIQVMGVLLHEKKYQELEHYLFKIEHQKNLRTIDYTGNVLVDALLLDVFGIYMDQSAWSFDFMGKFSNGILLDELDLCTLFSNAFRNAREAAEKCEKKEFCMKIRYSESELCVEIINSILETEIDLKRTSKEDKENHGYGVRNMKRVVEENQGEITWKIRGSRMIVIIYLTMNKK